MSLFVRALRLPDISRTAYRTSSRGIYLNGSCGTVSDAPHRSSTGRTTTTKGVEAKGGGGGRHDWREGGRAREKQRDGRGAGEGESQVRVEVGRCVDCTLSSVFDLWRLTACRNLPRDKRLDSQNSRFYCSINLNFCGMFWRIKSPHDT